MCLLPMEIYQFPSERLRTACIPSHPNVYYECRITSSTNARTLKYQSTKTRAIARHGRLPALKSRTMDMNYSKDIVIAMARFIAYRRSLFYGVTSCKMETRFISYIIYKIASSTS
jgi:hypothetical protein